MCAFDSSWNFHPNATSCHNNAIASWTLGLVSSYLHLGLVPILKSSISSQCEQKLTFALLKFILAPSTSSSAVNFNFYFIFTYGKCLHWHSHRQWLKLGFSHNVTKATEKVYLEMPAADCWALNRRVPPSGFSSSFPAFYLVCFHNPCEGWKEKSNGNLFLAPSP